MKTTIRRIAIAVMSGCAILVTGGLAHAQHEMAAHQGVAQDAMSDGEIRKVDKDAGKLTIKHGELKNLGMPAMTMAFKVKDRAMLDKVKQGDKVHFVVEKVGGVFTVTHIEAAQ